MSPPQYKEKPDSAEMQEFREHFTLIQADVAEVKSGMNTIMTAIVGDEALGHKGLAEQIRELNQVAIRHDEKLASHASRFLVWGAYITAVGTIISLAIAAYSARLVP